MSWWLVLQAQNSLMERVREILAYQRKVLLLPTLTAWWGAETPRGKSKLLSISLSARLVELSAADSRIHPEFLSSGPLISWEVPPYPACKQPMPLFWPLLSSGSTDAASLFHTAKHTCLGFLACMVLLDFLGTSVSWCFLFVYIRTSVSRNSCGVKTGEQFYGDSMRWMMINNACRTGFKASKLWGVAGQLFGVHQSPREHLKSKSQSG